MDFYNRKPLEVLQSLSELQEYLGSDDKPMVFLLEKDFENLPEEVNGELTIVDKMPLRRGKGTLLLVERRDDRRVR